MAYPSTSSNTQDPIENPMEEEGFFPTARRKLFGARIARISERKASAHFLSYLMIVAQSIAVLLVFGHAEVPLLLSGDIAVVAIAMLVLFLLIITVVAADWALIESVLRLGALARNRQFGALTEHLVYIMAVLLTEGVTYGVVLIVVETHPQALTQPAPIIPIGSFLFFAVAFLRVVLTGWTIVQLIIVSTTLPVMLSTIMSQGKEIIGAHALRQMARLNISKVPVSATVRTYARMDTPPRPIRTWWNGGLVDRAIAKEAEEARIAGIVIEALEDLGVPGATPLPAPEPTPEPPLVPPSPDGTRDGTRDLSDRWDYAPAYNPQTWYRTTQESFPLPAPITPETAGYNSAAETGVPQGGLNTRPLGGTSDVSQTVSQGVSRQRKKAIKVSGTSDMSDDTPDTSEPSASGSRNRKPAPRRLTVAQRVALNHAAVIEVRRMILEGNTPTQTWVKATYHVNTDTAKSILAEARNERMLHAVSQ